MAIDEGPAEVESEVRQRDLPSSRLSSEQAYRRGYYQGFYEAVSCIRDGISISKAEHHLYGVLYRWRYVASLRKTICPPELDIHKRLRQRGQA